MRCHEEVENRLCADGKTGEMQSGAKNARQPQLRQHENYGGDDHIIIDMNAEEVRVKDPKMKEEKAESERLRECKDEQTERPPNSNRKIREDPATAPTASSVILAAVTRASKVIVYLIG